MTEYDLTERYHGVVAEVHYWRAHPDFDGGQCVPGKAGLPTYSTGLLTTEHSTSSHGHPVWIAGSNYRTTDPLVPGQVYGPADLPAGYEMVVLPYHHLTDESCLPVAARSAGYNCQIGEAPDA